MKMNKFIWGVCCIIAAALVLVNQLGVFKHFNLWFLLFAIFLIPNIISGIARRNFFQFFCSLGILFIIYRYFYKNLWGFFLFPRISSWSIMLAMILLAIGFSSIFKSQKSQGASSSSSSEQYNTHEHYSHDTDASDRNHDSTEYSNDSDIYCSVSLGGCSKYPHTQNLQRGFLDCNFGSLKVFFDNATPHPNGATLNVECSLGSIELFIPRSWNVILNIDASLGSVEEQARPAYANGPVVTISGNVSLGSLIIRYV